jgi:hypothetical protein
MLEGLKKLAEDYADVTLAISEKKKELKNVHGIVAEADSYVALVQAKKDLAKEKDEKATQIIADAQEKADSILEKANAEKDELEAGMKEKLDEFHKDTERQEQEFDYEFARKKKKANDSLDDEIAGKKKFLDAQVADIAEREDAVSNVEERIETYDAEISQMKDDFKDAVERRVDEEKKKLEKSKYFEVSTLKTNHASEIAIKENENSLLTMQVTDLKAQLDVAMKSVELANEKVAGIASESLKATANEKTLESVLETVKNSNQGKK